MGSTYIELNLEFENSDGPCSWSSDFLYGSELLNTDDIPTRVIPSIFYLSGNQVGVNR